ncbi:MAG: DNA polymerase III [Treponema sp.]|nr:DNA polymerase III [Treponema sp.]
MFENIIEQAAALQLQEDILSRRLAPSMLFFGPSESGKSSAALELARILSCEEDASWKCYCPSCESHRYLQHSDLLILGSRPFSAEISACCSAFLRSPASSGAKILFIRSLRKLQIRFSAVLLEDDPKLGKVSPLLQALEEGLNGFWTAGADITGNALEKLCGSLVKDALSLADAGLSGNIPIGHIRRAAYWCRLAPNGRRKTLLIENAENMRDDACNSLLKLLEEPPDTVTIVLTSQRREAVIPTILSRLRPYRFLKRSAESEKEVLRRVFQETSGANYPKTEGSLISAYLDSFMTGSAEKLYPLAAWFIVSIARITAAELKKNGSDIPWIINSLGERYAQAAPPQLMELKSIKIQVVVKTVIAESGNFEDGSFPRFLNICLGLIADAARKSGDPGFIAYNDILKRHISEAETATGVLNQGITLALEALVYKIKTAIPKITAAGAFYARG